MNLKTIKLKNIGINVEDVVNRLGGNEEIYLTICNKFISDENYAALQNALAKREFNTAEFKIHTLKGIAANLGFTKMEIISKSMLQSIRERNEQRIRHDNACLIQEYDRIISILKQA
jgi:HPt (histidine-containing phosphotransfer) domain-containing protein